MRTQYHEYKVRKLRLCEAPAVLDASSPEAMVDCWHKGPATASWFDEDKECLVAFTLDQQLKCKGFFMIAVGCLNEVTARIPDILKPVIVNSSYSFVLAHNHPSGNATPSQADIELTLKLVQASRTVGIRLQDHIIMGSKRFPGDRGYYSFREGGII